MPRGGGKSSSGGSRSGGGGGGGGRTYVDNASNRSLGRVGMSVGSMVVSSGGSRSSGGSQSSGASSASSASRTYVDNASNRSLGRVGMPLGSMVSSGGSKSSDASSASSDVKVYKDNAFNRKLGRVGNPIGSAVYSRTSKSSDPHQVYVDNPTNRSLGRVGLPRGSRPQASSSTRNRTYVDNTLNRRLNRVGKILGTAPMSRSKKTEFMKKAYSRARERPDEDFEYDNLPIFEEEDENYVLDQVLDMLNRLRFGKEWKEQSGTRDPPRTSKSAMAYSGPTIDYADIHLGKVIGRGAFGLVYHAKWKGSILAVKMLHVSRVSKRRLKAFQDEANVLSHLDHPFIVKFIGACTVTPNLCLVMEYMQMSLFEALHVDNEDLADLTDEDRLLMINQTAQGMDYLHSKNIAHCDVKSQNILIDHDGEKFLVAKITDFGLAMMKSETETSQSSSEEVVRNIGTPRYSAPEVLRGEMLGIDQIKKVDMYSYALVVYEIVFEQEPFANLNAQQLRVQVGVRGLLPEFPRDLQMDNDLEALLLACWDRSPDKRPTANRFLSMVKELAGVYKEL